MEAVQAQCVRVAYSLFGVCVVGMIGLIAFSRRGCRMDLFGSVLFSVVRAATLAARLTIGMTAVYSTVSCAVWLGRG